jgi:hypothetical protein
MSTPTGDVRPRREYASYVAAAFGIALIVLLVAGTAVYAGVHTLFSPIVAVDASRGIVVVRDVAPDPIVALDAVILAMIGLLAVVGASSPPSLKSTRAPTR